jgi:phosphoserine phosphatase
VIVLGRPLRAGALSSVAQRVADHGGNIESVAQLSSEPVSAVELIVSCDDPAGLGATLVQAADETGIDIAIEPAGLRRRAKRLVVLDVDSTLIRDEGIDVLAERAGVGAQVAAVTERAMAGDLDFAESLRERVALLAGLPVADVEAVRDRLRLTPGARTFVRTLRRLGFHVGVVSGGFTVFTDRFVAELELDFAAANELEVVDGKLTGKVLGPIVDRAGKARALERFAEQFGVPLSQTVAVGDGANDIDMLEVAGLGIAFNAKAALRAAADTSVNLPYLDSVLFVLGISREEIDEAVT